MTIIKPLNALNIKDTGKKKSNKLLVAKYKKHFWCLTNRTGVNPHSMYLTLEVDCLQQNNNINVTCGKIKAT